MTPAGRHPPAWYPDPGDPTRLRRWNGSSWTRDVRPPPAWVRSVRLAPGPPGRSLRRTSRWLWISSATVLALALLLAAALSGRGAVGLAPRVSDAEFVRQANDLCAATDQQVVRLHPPTGGSGPAEARRVAALADGFLLLVDQLRAVPVPAADREAVDRWLGAWDRYVVLGYQRAEALDEGDREEADRANREAVAPKREINRFAVANGLDRCLF